MTTPLESNDDLDLKRVLRDLLGLLALPAGWRGRSPEEILVSFSEALETTINVDVVVVSALGPEDSEGAVRVHGADATARADEVRGWFASLAASTASSLTRLPCGELGELSVICEPIGYYAALGQVVLASGRYGFPSPVELVVIRAAVALATSALETARAMREREAAVRSREDFMAVLGHELRNPLAPIGTVLEILRHRHGRLSREEQVIERQVEHLGRLVDDLLDIARITRGTIELKRSRVELSEVVEQAVEASASLYQSRRHELRVDVPRTGIAVYADRFRLLQILVNLMTNAARYTPEGGHVAVTAAVHADRLRLSVRDSGIGMAPRLLERVFEPFVQGNRSSDPRYGGLGIGLALVHTLVELHGGTVTARSEGVGRGSRFDLELPLAPPEAVPVSSSMRAERTLTVGSRAHRILIVDDNVDSGEMLGDALELAGHEIRVVHDPFTAGRAAHDFAANIVILDIGMPGRDGYGVASDIREYFGARPPALIAVTGYGQATDRAKTAAAGFDAHFVKPVDLFELTARIGSM